MREKEIRDREADERRKKAESEAWVEEQELNEKIAKEESDRMGFLIDDTRRDEDEMRYNGG